MVEHHIFLFRHCVRSAKYSFSKHVDEIPDWQVPEGWCLGKTATTLIQDTGYYLGHHVLGQHNRNLEFEIIADPSSQRDVDTSHYLQRGLKKALGPMRGLDTIFTDFPWVYDKRACSTFYEEEESKAEILQTIKTKRRPDLNLTEAIALSRELLAGKGDPFKDLSHDIGFDVNKWFLTGVVGQINDFAQILFYSKAVGLPYNISNATTNQVYQLLQYHHWFRSILRLDNTWAASKGAVWMNYLNKKIEESVSSFVPKATILVGHDSDMDYLATVLGVSWDPEGYQSHRDFLATPPGSAIHFTIHANSRSLQETSVKLEFLAPIYHNQKRSESQTWEASLSGKLYNVPVLHGNKPFLVSYEGLQRHVALVLNQWPISLECYEQSKAIMDRFYNGKPTVAPYIGEPTTRTTLNPRLGIVAGSLFGALLLALLCCFNCCKRYPPPPDGEEERHRLKSFER